MEDLLLKKIDCCMWFYHLIQNITNMSAVWGNFLLVSQSGISRQTRIQSKPQTLCSHINSKLLYCATRKQLAVCGYLDRTGEYHIIKKISQTIDIRASRKLATKIRGAQLEQRRNYYDNERWEWPLWTRIGYWEKIKW